ncbi:PAS domain S-box protein [Algoriphagus aestuariicola]|jgi:PAS domain S-box-containing protein|uniref:histidine kinase n=1 Tax=Algoriphagus aestuariicola TaxID=1852016 RepID=A0ABS3BME1_9BACT|nr:PAS domain S-box protein [Algoriphagus aestuariicola]MBN7799401.1 PAS domain S-box protein [Algoriphagus aestuariicola]
MQKNRSRYNAKIICLSYLVVGVSWILFSDSLASYFFSDDIRKMSQFQLFKGFFYVGITTLMLYFLIRKMTKSINKRKLELELLFSNPNLGILKLDAAGLFTQVSHNIATITGYSSEELVGKHINHYTPENRKEEDDAELAKVTNSNPNDDFVFRKHILSKDGQEVIIRGYGMRTKPSKNESPGYIVAIQNITEEIRFLLALEAHNAQLKELASEQSHLVRAPLARIMGITNILQDPDSLEQTEKTSLIQNLEVSAQELDLALRGISQKMNSNPNGDKA